MLQVWTDPLFRARVDYRLKLVLVTRTIRPFSALDEVTEAHARLEQELRPYASIERAIVLDSRVAPQLVPAFEPTFVAANMRLFRPFRRCCVVVGTPSGLTQGRRLKSRTVINRELLITSSYEDAAVHVGAPGLVALLREADGRGASALNR